MDKLKVAVIGTGHLGRFHTKLFNEIDSCQLTGIYDNDSQRAEIVSKEFNVPVFADLNSVIKSVNAVSIAATTSAHYDLAKFFLQNGKHVFIEKPITAKISEAEEIVSLAKEKNLKLQVGHVERFNPALLALENFIVEPMFIQSDRLAQFNPRGTDVAVVLDLMIHDIDIILNLVKSEVKKVDANGVAVVSDTLDIANARIEFENGAVANVTASRISQKKMRKMRLFQRDNYISIDFNSAVSEIFRLVPLEQEVPSSISFGELGAEGKKKKIIYEQAEVKEINALKYELELFIDSVVKDIRPVVSGEDGLKALKVADIIIKTIEKNKIKN
ncbi:MAG: Gfo/Idh/MocA family oxidoreductase [Ignavibacteriaceae bacterium]|nr:Gfo/Idh/MocA family oxidoreductase [Ignavibacteriaceae bacterium]